MKKMYLNICVSTIYTLKNNAFLSDIWKFASNFLISSAVTCNLLMLYLIIDKHLFINRLHFLIIEFTNTGKFNFLLNLMVYFLMPVMILNYIYVFKGENYLQLVKDNKKYYNKKMFAIYLSLSFLLAIMYAFVGKSLQNM